MYDWNGSIRSLNVGLPDDIARLKAAGYYKAAISGARTVEESDAGFVNRFAQICEPEDMLLSYLYQNAVSPQLAARIEG